MFSKTESIIMHLSGVHDVATQRAATQVLRRLDGVRSVTVDRHSAMADIVFRPDKTSVPTLTNALAQAGFTVI